MHSVFGMTVGKSKLVQISIYRSPYHLSDHAIAIFICISVTPRQKYVCGNRQCIRQRSIGFFLANRRTKFRTAPFSRFGPHFFRHHGSIRNFNNRAYRLRTYMMYEPSNNAILQSLFRSLPIYHCSRGDAKLHPRKWK